MHSNIFAYTAPGGSYPEYLSLNRQEDGSITLDVRAPVGVDGQCGPSVQIKLPKDEVALLGKAIIADVTPADVK